MSRGCPFGARLGSENWVPFLVAFWGPPGLLEFCLVVVLFLRRLGVQNCSLCWSIAGPKSGSAWAAKQGHVLEERGTEIGPALRDRNLSRALAPEWESH